MPIRAVSPRSATTSKNDSPDLRGHRRAETIGEKRARAQETPRAAPAPPAKPPKLIPLPDVRQATGYTCGAAALMSLMSYYGSRGDDPAEKYFAQELGTNWRNGTEPEEIVRMARKLGIDADMKNGMSLAEVSRHVKAGRPVMVAFQAYPLEGSPFPKQKPWSEDWNDGHWAIVIGVDDDNVYLEDPSMLGKRGFIPKAEFVERWHDTNNKNEHVFKHLGIVFSSDTPKRDLNPVHVEKLTYLW